MITGCEKGNVRGDVQYAAAQYTPVGCDAPDTAHLRDRCIHELIGAQALRTPAAIAIAGEMEQVSYRELARRAAALACRLRVLGVGPDVLVGLCVERSSAMIVGLLGILTAGGAYVPLDPSYPSDRLAFMLADARPAVLVTQRRLPAPSPELACPVIYLDDLDDAGGATPADDPAPAPHPDHLAYVIYTSGSTGRPKGVMISHRNLVHSTVARLRYYQEPVGRYLLLSSLSFDSSVAGIFWTLCQGGTLWIPPTAAVGDAAMLADCIANHCITHLLCVPSLYTHLLAAATPAHLQTLKVAIVAGEECPPSLVRLHHERIPGVQLFNEYGPTEGTVWSTVHACTPRSALGRVPIGRPIDGVQVYILDADRQPVPAGADGELAIGGAGLARGYLHRPELTRERFVHNPCSAEPGGRLYRTGDLARRRPDGLIEFLGRLDQQVKIRGYRIELGEIEATLLQHPHVQQAAVIAREDVPGDPRLVAYVVPHTGSAASTDWQRFLADRLPAYMVPAIFMTLARFPLTPNGKVDRAALPPPTRSPRDERSPRTSREAAIAAIWAEVLGIERVGIDDDFFEFGGDSLHVMQLATRLSRELGAGISARFVLDHPTVAAFAAALDTVDLERRSYAADQPVQSHVAGDADHADRHRPAVQRERRPLLSLYAAGKLGPVDAIAVDYLQEALLQPSGMSREELERAWCAGLPLVHGVVQTPIGCFATIIIPVWDRDLYSGAVDLIGPILDALRIGAHLGARVASLTGLLPSATDYGRAVQAAIAGQDDLPRVSTGHATTAAAVALAVRRILREAGRELTGERLGCLGLGSIGGASLRLLLRCMPHPTEITLCDVYGKQDALVALGRELRDALGFRGRLRVLATRGAVPDDFYDASLIIGATNVPNILDIGRVRPGALIVDDSAPHCFSLERAIQRLLEKGDVLFTDGGALRTTEPIKELVYMPAGSEQYVDVMDATFCRARDPYEIMGCEFSSVLSARYRELAPTTGLVDTPMCTRHLAVLDHLGVKAATLDCGAFRLPATAIRAFHTRFGRGDQEALTKPIRDS